MAAARPYLSGADWERREQEWMGPRQMTPDGLPLIGLVPGQRPCPTGHRPQMLAPATGRLVGGLVRGEAGLGPAARFAPGRTVRRRG